MNSKVRFALMIGAFISPFGIHTPQTHAGGPSPRAPVRIFYCDPIKGSMNGDGSKARPWKSLQEVWTANLINGEDNSSGAVHAGDLVYLMSGTHGSLTLSPYSGSRKIANTDYITIQAAPGTHPILNSLYLSNCSKWVFRGLTIQNPAVITTRPTLVYAQNSDSIVVDSNNIYSAPNVLNWTPQNWSTLSAVYGIFFNAVRDSKISNNNIRNVENGISISGDSILVTGNQIDYFANDGIQFSSSNLIISRNRITNHYGKWDDGFHHDGMQGWTAYNEDFTTNVVIDSNIVLASTGIYPQIPSVPTGIGDDYMQGISIFDGDWRNVTVTNNVVAAAAYHGLAMYGASNTLIANNTVIKQTADPDVTTWLAVMAGKGDASISKVTIRNNIANRFLIKHGLIDDHNVSLSVSNNWSDVKSNKVVADPRLLFVQYNPSRALFDLNLKAGSPAIGAGLLQLSPPSDILGRVRLLGRTDAGAYIYTGK